MIKFILILLFYCLIFHSTQAGEIYKWLDVEGVKQFSNKAPPPNCKTPSCIKLQKKISRKVQQKKDVQKAQIEDRKSVV